MKIRYSELFASFQGEAEFTGMPSIWFRFFGCNLTCARFGHTSDNPADWANPYQNIDLSKIKFMEDLPVLDKGCDSGYSWSSKFKHLAYDQNESELASQILRVAKEKLGVDHWIHPVTKRPAQLCFTGGEPMMQQKAMAAIVSELVANAGDVNLPQVTIETNGTKKLDMASMADIKSKVNVLHFAISPKLYAVSGEKDAVKRDIINSYCSIADSVAMKFVVNGTDECWRELEQYEFWLRDLPATLWLMPVGATVEQQTGSHISKLADEIIRRGYQVAARVHAYVHGNAMST